MKCVKRLVAVIVTVALFAVGLLTVSNLMQSKTSDIKYRDFYASDEEYDVLLCGSSHMMNTVYPMELWKEYGIKAYNIANSTEAVATSYWVLKNALDYKKPKVVILEAFMAGNFKVSPNNEAFLHNYFDALPLSKNKIDALRDLLPANKIAEYIFDFSLYHSRWEELVRMDFEKDRNLNKGAGAMVGVYINQEVEFTDEVGNVGKTSAEYIRKIKELCDKEGIELVLMISPYAATVDEQKGHNAIYGVAEEIGVDCLNLIDKNVVDYQIDMFDRGHCNSAGGKRVTSYIGDYLINTYGKEFFDQEADIDTWNEAYEEYADDLAQAIIDERSLQNTLVRLQNPIFSGEITVKEGSNLLEDESIVKLLERMNAESVHYSAELESDIVIDIRKNGSDEVIEHKEFDTQRVLVGTYK